MTALLRGGGAFALSLALSLLLLPLAIAAGKRFKLTVRPRLHGRGRRGQITYLGGAVVAVATTVSVISIAGVSREMGIVLAGAAVLLIVGLVDDRLAPHGISPLLRFAIQTVAAIFVWQYALKGDSDGLFEAFIAIFLLVGAANAVNLLDNMDGVAGATSAGTAIGIAALAMVSNDAGTGAVAAAMAGACLGFLTVNLVRPRAYLGDGGALFVGFLLAATALKLRPAFGPGWGPVATVALLSVLATDSSLVILARFLKGKSLFTGGTDHTSHRLVKLGMSTRVTALAHGLAAMVAGGMCVLAWFAGPRIMVAAITLFAVGGAALLVVPIYKEAPISSLRRRLVVAIAVSLLAGVLLAVPPALAAAGLLRDARQDLIRGISLARELKADEAKQAFALAGRSATKADSELNSLLTFPLGAVPLLRDNLTAAREIASGTSLMVPAAIEAVGAMNLFPDSGVGLTDGRIDLESWAKAEPNLISAATQTRLALSRVRPDEGFLLPSVARARESFLLEGDKAVETLERAADAADLIPALFGAEGPRTWFLAIQNPVEMRATGGFLGAFGILKAEAGQIKLERLESDLALPPLANPPQPPAGFPAQYLRFEGNSLWQNANMTPDFPTAAGLITKMWAQRDGRKPDGVIAVDAQGLTHLLRLVGPVSVKGAGEVTADNFLRLALNEAYIRFPDNKAGRVDFLLEVGKQVWGRLLSGDFQNVSSMAGSLGEAVSGKHLQIWLESKAPSVERLGISGAIKPAKGSDYLYVVGQNAAANKVDYYAQRRITYRVAIAKDRRVTGKVDVRLANATPQGLPSSIVGPYLPSDPAGLNRSFLSVFTAPRTGVSGARVDGAAVGVESHTERGLQVASRFLEVLPGDASNLSLHLEGHQSRPGEYRLVVQHQPTLNPDNFRLELTLPEGAFVQNASPGFKITGRRLVFEGPLIADQQFFVRYGMGLIERLRSVLGPDGA